MVETYAAGDEHVSILRSLFGSLGPVGKILSAILGDNKQLSAQKRSAINYLESLADEPDVLQSLVRILEGKGAKVVWPGDATVEAIKAPQRGDRKSTRLNSSHIPLSRMPSSA